MSANSACTHCLRHNEAGEQKARLLLQSLKISNDATHMQVILTKLKNSRAMPEKTCVQAQFLLLGPLNLWVNGDKGGSPPTVQREAQMKY